MAIDYKKVALNIGEDAVKSAIKSLVRPLAEEYIKNSANKLDDVLLPFLDHLEKALLEIVDKVDGEVDAKV
jgi:hypothetical protein